MKRMTKEIADALEKEIERLRLEVVGLWSRHHDYYQTEWTGGDSNNPENYKIPDLRIELAFAEINTAWNSLNKASHHMVMWEIEGKIPYRYGNDQESTWFHARFEKTGEKK
jgi:hypothetical protein